MQDLISRVIESGRRQRDRPLALVGTATAILIFVSACAADNGSDTTTDEPASTATETTAATITTTTLPTTTTSEEPTATSFVAAVDVDPSAILGTWRTVNYFMHFEEDGDSDGRWSVSSEPNSGTFDSGEYSFDGEELTISSRQQGPCQGGVGVYQITFSASLDEVRVSPITPDECMERQSEMVPRLTRLGS